MVYFWVDKYRRFPLGNPEINFVTNCTNEHKFKRCLVGVYGNKPKQGVCRYACTKDVGAKSIFALFSME